MFTLSKFCLICYGTGDCPARQEWCPCKFLFVKKEQRTHVPCQKSYFKLQVRWVGLLTLAVFLLFREGTWGMFRLLPRPPKPNTSVGGP